MAEADIAKLRDPFEDRHVGKLPKPTKKQNDCSAGERISCTQCGGWHHPKVIHVDYVGHAALTDRLLDVDLKWNWEPLAYTELGLPAFDETGGLWIKLTVGGVTRIGYGHAVNSQYKSIGDREKEVIGDALRNAAMRFGAALDLWHKGDLHEDPLEGPLNRTDLKKAIRLFIYEIWQANTIDEFNAITKRHKAPLKQAKEQWNELLDGVDEEGFDTINHQYNKKKKQLEEQAEYIAAANKEMDQQYKNTVSK